MKSLVENTALWQYPIVNLFSVRPKTSRRSSEKRKRPRPSWRLRLTRMFPMLQIPLGSVAGETSIDDKRMAFLGKNQLWIWGGLSTATAELESCRVWNMHEHPGDTFRHLLREPYNLEHPPLSRSFPNRKGMDFHHFLLVYWEWSPFLWGCKTTCSGI